MFSLLRNLKRFRKISGKGSKLLEWCVYNFSVKFDHLVSYQFRKPIYWLIEYCVWNFDSQTSWAINTVCGRPAQPWVIFFCKSAMPETVTCAGCWLLPHPQNVYWLCCRQLGFWRIFAFVGRNGECLAWQFLPIAFFFF